ncbi:hypothetical protein [Actinoplanes sp. HUAS TT8]|uniref:hypothetical protein n=1 Tax=Actinoplanes sp. HUAS TT8 TaxID=3447453 RepID=UPI003F51B31F
MVDLREGAGRRPPPCQPRPGVPAGSSQVKLAGLPALGFPVATCVREPAADPAGPIWRPAGADRRRLRLGELPGGHGGAARLGPGPAEPGQHPLALLTGVALRP